MTAIAATVALSRHTFLEGWQLVPAVLGGMAEWVMLWAVVTALCGRLYCSTACPLGTLQDFLARLRRRRYGYFYARPVPVIRWLATVAFIVAAFLGLAAVVSALDPAARFESMPGWVAELVRTGTFTLASGAAAALTLIVTAIFAVSRGRLLCNTICPVGTVLGAFSRYSLYQIDINTDKCVGCGLCTAKCKAQCIDPGSHTVDFSRCVVCFDCVASCPTDAITFRKDRHRLQLPLMQEAPRPAGAVPCTAPESRK